MINEANEPSSACRLQRVFQVETSTPPISRTNLAHFPLQRKAQIVERHLSRSRRRSPLPYYQGRSGKKGLQN